MKKKRRKEWEREKDRGRRSRVGEKGKDEKGREGERTVVS